MRHPSDEAVLFGRLAIFGLVVGRRLLVPHLRDRRHGPAHRVRGGIDGCLGLAVVEAATGRPGGRPADGDVPAGWVVERIPAPAFAPLIVGAGVAITALGLALGP